MHRNLIYNLLLVLDTHLIYYPVFDRIEKRKVLQTSVDVGLEHFLFIS